MSETASPATPTAASPTAAGRTAAGPTGTSPTGTSPTGTNASATSPSTADQGRAANRGSAGDLGSAGDQESAADQGIEAWFAAPVLTGALVRLEPMALDHVDGFLAAADDEVLRHLSIPPLRTRDDVVQWVGRVFAARDDRVLVPWTQVDSRTGEVAGTTSYYEVSPVTRSVAIGYTWLGQRWWRTGVNTEAKLLLLQRAFEELGAVRVVWHTDIRNDRSQAAIARLGAEREGVLRKHKPRRDGSWRDTVQYAMTDDDWPGVRDRLRARLAAA
ncbi:GNAT family protein [Actinopolymorpha sp. B11F2]|uniref:GNAT family N-acetyltransferase n=1 Tax=Actinopolymorpha sp. B11F2 TaxID=3160862 RepID=UPI0032E45CBB